jgi:hypothetical protein
MISLVITMCRIQMYASAFEVIRTRGRGVAHRFAKKILAGSSLFIS